MDADLDVLVFPLFGMAFGMTMGTFSNQIPFGFTIVAWIAVGLSIFKGISTMSFLLLGIAVGTMVATFANLVPFGYMILAWEGYFFALLMSSSNNEGNPRTRASLFIQTPLVLIVIGGLLFAASPDFAQNISTQAAKGWNGCVSSCSLSTFSILPSTIFSPLVNGDFIGFLSSFFTSAQTAIPIISIAIGAVLLLIGMGVGASLSFLGSGVQFSINEAGTRLAGSIGITLLLYGAITALFGTWFSALDFGIGFGTFMQIMIAGVVFYGGYLQGKENVA